MSCFTEPKKEETNTPKIEILEPKKQVVNTQDTLLKETKPTTKVEDIIDNMLVETFDYTSEIINHYNGCVCNFSTTRESFIDGKMIVFYGNTLGTENSSIEIMINNKIERLYFVKKENADDKVYYRYSNSEHEATMELKKEENDGDDFLYLSGGIIVDEKRISGLFGVCKC